MHIYIYKTDKIRNDPTNRADIIQDDDECNADHQQHTHTKAVSPSSSLGLFVRMTNLRAHRIWKRVLLNDLSFRYTMQGYL